MQDQKPWFTVDQVDPDTYIISEYRHWEETHCYLLNAGTALCSLTRGWASAISLRWWLRWPGAR